MRILKEEINQVTADVLSLSKWKLSIVAIVSAAGLGWSDFKPDSSTGLLLLYSIGFICAYIDWIIYRRYSVIHTIARYLRNYSGTNEETKELQTYELSMQEARLSSSFFLSERWANFIASLIFSIGIPVLGAIQYQVKPDQRILIPFFGVLITIYLFISYNQQRKELLK
jgi:hypothetical protein